jgi:hypothetical protein
MNDTLTDLQEEVERLRLVAADFELDISELKTALEKIKFRNHPGTTNHELAKEALSHD